jgi:integrase
MAKAPQAKVIAFPKQRKRAEKARKSGLNHNKEGSVRNVNGTVYVDFMYLDERVRETSGLPWNENNAKAVREQLDKIIVAIKDGTFRFAEVFPQSKKAEYFIAKEKKVFKIKETPQDIRCKGFFDAWYDLLKNSGRVTGRTLLGYRRYMDLYLEPFFGEMALSDLNAASFERFIVWAKGRRYRKKEIAASTINKCFTILKIICKSAAIEYKWCESFNPFFGFRKLPEDDPYEEINPFSIDEQRSLLDHLPDHWKPYFRFAFAAGLRVGEQIAIRPEDIDWKAGLLHVRRAMTLDEDGKRVMGRTKNRYSRRTIKLIPAMLEPLKAEAEIYEQFKGEYFFCSPQGIQVDVYNLRNRVWVPALKRSGLQFRELKQTRHSFATVALSCGENPLWIARVMGHRNTDMIIRVYGKYIEKSKGIEDGGLLNCALMETAGNKGKNE